MGMNRIQCFIHLKILVFIIYRNLCLVTLLQLIKSVTTKLKINAYINKHTDQYN